MHAPQRMMIDGELKWTNKKAYFVEYLLNKYTTMTPTGIDEASVRDLGRALGLNAISAKLNEMVRAGHAEKISRGIYRIKRK